MPGLLRGRYGKKGIVIAVVVVVGVFAWQFIQSRQGSDVVREEVRVTAPTETRGPISQQTDDLAVLFNARRSGVMVTVSGTIIKTLSDDNDGSRHQRFLIKPQPGLTVLVAHNIDLAPRVPLRQGDRIALRGQYEWNEKGGVLHWTHHDPAKRHDEGWIEHEGKRYQ